MKLHVLGAGTPIPTGDRYGNSCLLEVAGDRLMFDCGPAATHKLVRAGFQPTDVDHLFFTHHHYDHNVDYACFVLCRWDQGAGCEPDLQVWGPPPTVWITHRLLGEDGAFSHDWKARIAHPGSQQVYVNRGGTLPRRAPTVEATEVGPGRVTQGREWSVTAVEAHHTEPWLTSLAYRVDSSEGSIVFAGDSGPSESLSELAQDVDNLVVHCWDHQDALRTSGEGPGEMGTLEAARVAEACGVGRLIINHTTPALARPGSRERAIGDIARRYRGEIVFAEELMALDLARALEQSCSSPG